MSAVTIKINGRPYTIGCDPGEEGRVSELGNYIDQQVQKIALSGGTATDSHLLVLASIVICDELFEYKDMLSNTQNQYQAVSQKLEQVSAELEELKASMQNGSNECDNQASVDEHELANIVSSLAGRIEDITSKYKKQI